MKRFHEKIESEHYLPYLSYNLLNVAKKIQISVVGSTKRNNQPKIRKKHLHHFYSNFKMCPNFPYTRHIKKLAIKLATKQVSINMISISIKEGWGRVKHV